MNKNTPREEDYRDYEERDIADGWPYADEAGSTAGASQNKPYGDTGNFDGDPNSGFRTEIVDENGKEEGIRDSLTPESLDRADSDDIEARITDKLEEIADLDVTSIDVHVDGHTVTLEGSVETAAQSRQVELVAMATAGVRKVRNQLETIGVDARIPDDD